MRAGSQYMPAAVPGRTSCEPEPCSALPMQPGERWSCPDRCRWMRCACDDPPDVNCRAKSYSAADHLINPHYTSNLIGLPGISAVFLFQFSPARVEDIERLLSRV